MDDHVLDLWFGMFRNNNRQHFTQFDLIPFRFFFFINLVEMKKIIYQACICNNTRQKQNKKKKQIEIREC